jgi:tagatose-1,6-bisphosphate aldolase non-catalytic subunit AgaZ/GatZ
MGGANVGPEFTAVELSALRTLCAVEERSPNAGVRSRPSQFIPSLEKAVLESGRWKKWLLPGEAGIPFGQLDSARREWLVATGARYVWTNPEVVQARQRLYEHVRGTYPDPHSWIVEQIARSVERYVDAFNLRDSMSLLSR